MSEDVVTLRSALAKLPAYTPGKPASAPPGVAAYKISSNENPFPPLPSVLGAVQDAAGAMNRYPDMGVTELTETLAARLDVPPERLAFGPGSVGVRVQLGSSLAWRSCCVRCPWCGCSRPTRSTTAPTCDWESSLREWRLP